MSQYAKLQYVNGKNIITLPSEELKKSAQRDLIQYAMLSGQAEDYAGKVKSSDISSETKQFYQKQLKSLEYRLGCYRDYLYKSYRFYPIGVDTLEDVSEYSFVTEDALAKRINNTSFYSDLENIEQSVAVMENDIHENVVNTDTTQNILLNLPEQKFADMESVNEIYQQMFATDSPIEKVSNTAMEQFGDT